MFATIQDTLSRQDKALDLMKELLEEEFSLLTKRDTDAIMTIEFSIHELLRQLATEKESIIKALGGGRLKDYAQMLPADKKEIIISRIIPPQRTSYSRRGTYTNQHPQASILSARY